MNGDPQDIRHVVIGAGGFIGSNLTSHLGRAGFAVLAIDPAPGALAGFANAPNVETLEAALGEDATRFLKAGDIVHVVTGGSIPDARGADPRRQLDQTVGLTLTLLDACVTAGVRRVLFPSSGGTVYGPPLSTPISEDHPTDPISAYGVQKLALEKYLGVYRRLNGLDAISLRIANPFGPRQSPAGGQGLIASLVYRALKGEPIEIWGDGAIVRDYLFVDDLCEAMMLLARYEGEHRVFNIGAGVGRSVNDVVETIQRVLPEHRLNIQRRPGRPFDVPVSVLDTARVRHETGWAPRVDFEEGVTRTVAWQRANLQGLRG